MISKPSIKSSKDSAFRVIHYKNITCEQYSMHGPLPLWDRKRKYEGKYSHYCIFSCPIMSRNGSCKFKKKHFSNLVDMKLVWDRAIGIPVNQAWETTIILSCILINVRFLVIQKIEFLLKLSTEISCHQMTRINSWKTKQIDDIMFWKEIFIFE